ncbi:hypothetical protein MIND_01078600 [Mycena indigotica]|uniref:Uncharacterized protein n=1 Tax=Mycena indigotica TaxID=2126181 RepID=A0A8H6SCL2_9AGAR|nr:uncharacterized protein MIND_01078600 [Mycena indigotica]KAF7295390.1 hypothetical protein MIND_01078600 [Mycena indigotica]
MARPKTLHPATLPFDQPPPQLNQNDAWGRTPFYILAWRVWNSDLSIYPNEFVPVDKYFTKAWYTTRRKHGISQHTRQPYVLCSIRPDEESDILYFIAATNRHRFDLTPDSLDIRITKETLQDIYEPYERELGEQLTDPIWYRVGAFDDSPQYNREGGLNSSRSPSGSCR